MLLILWSQKKDANDSNPLIRALALRTMSYIQVDKIIDCLCEPLRAALKDKDPYVRKTAAICIPKLYSFDKNVVETEGFLDILRDMMGDANSAVRTLNPTFQRPQKTK
jgi:AP-2 complex subunit beta-1